MILAAFTKVLHSSPCPEIYINNTAFVGERGVGGGGGVMTIWVRNEAICLCLELDSDTGYTIYRSIYPEDITC
jgi:hypothetical protein